MKNTFLMMSGIAVCEPITHDSMNARSGYFEDPDGNQPELCAPNG